MNKIKADRFNIGFTLAEVLITLGIIGVVAAITIPIIVSNQQKAATISQLKKSYATISQAMERMKADYGTMENWGLVNTDSQAGALAVYNLMKQYLSINKACGFAADSDPTRVLDCWAYGYNRDGSSGSYMPAGDWDCYVFTLNDGTSVGLFDYTNADNYRMRVHVDINGLKGPNRLGKDRFVFVAGSYSSYSGTSSLLKPNGTTFWTPPTRNDCYTGTGVYCSYTIITLDNWQIADDYPW